MNLSIYLAIYHLHYRSIYVSRYLSLSFFLSVSVSVPVSVPVSVSALSLSISIIKNYCFQFPSSFFPLLAYPVMSHRPSLQSIHVDSSYFDNSIDVTAPSSSSSASNRNGTNGTQMKSLLNRDRDSKQKETVMRNMYANMTTLPAAATSFFRGNNGPGLPIGLKAKQSNYVTSKASEVISLPGLQLGAEQNDF